MGQHGKWLHCGSLICSRYEFELLDQCTCIVMGPCTKDRHHLWPCLGKNCIYNIIGGWGAGDPTGKSISVSVRACVRAVVVRCESAEIVIRVISLFPFIPGSFPFSLLAWGRFPFPSPSPQPPIQLQLALSVGITQHILVITQNTIGTTHNSFVMFCCLVFWQT